MKPHVKSIVSRAFIAAQYGLPHHLLSRMVLHATRGRGEAWKDALIGNFLKHYPVDMSEAANPDPKSYGSFNEFFTRALKPGARPVDLAPSSIVSPVDGKVSAAGHINSDVLIQAKGHSYSLSALLGERDDGTGSLMAGGKWADSFLNGAFATVYLAPHNYHRIHMPLAGRLIGTRYVPGRLFSVNTATTQSVPGLFARNERVICLFETDAGRMAVILVGALFVGSMTTVWAGDITPAHRREITWLNPSTPLELAKGAELGRFNMGSTVVLLFQPNKARLKPSLTEGAPVQLGEQIGTLIAP